jgi:ubiquitin
MEWGVKRKEQLGRKIPAHKGYKPEQQKLIFCHQKVEQSFIAAYSNKTF